jgi:hypothetical protein
MKNPATLNVQPYLIWMPIRSHPDFLILPFGGPFGGEKARDGTKAGGTRALVGHCQKE